MSAIHQPSEGITHNNSGVLADAVPFDYERKMIKEYSFPHDHILRFRWDHSSKGFEFPEELLSSATEVRRALYDQNRGAAP